MKTTLIVGHRGVGKTSLLKRIQNYLGSNITTYDLDSEIEKRSGRKIEKIFATHGESEFRKLETQTLTELTSDSSSVKFISLGAGYSGAIPEDVEVLWVRRETDSNGRVFLDRPRLNTEVSAIDEYLERFEQREENYARIATRTLVLRESNQAQSETERAFFCNTDVPRNGLTTLMPGETVDVRFCSRVELRDDLFSKEELQDICNNLPADRMLFSCRDLNNGFVPPQGCQIDWALELGEPQHSPTTISCHNRLENESLESFFERLTRYKDLADLKAAPHIESFTELFLGHQWQQEDPTCRSFLPMSKDGRWKWYRLLMKGRSPLNFYRTSVGSAKDQPTLLEWLDAPTNAPSNAAGFAAVLGSPIKHSLTPTEHHEFFSPKNMPVLAVDVRLDEFEEAIPVLRQLGLRCAAVTSPLKEKAYSIATKPSERANDFLSANTLFFADNTVHADNTDGVGLEALKTEAQTANTQTTVFGGGGTLGPLRQTFSEAEFIAARTGLPRDHEGRPTPPETLVVAGSGQIPSDWAPKTIVDLSYTENSLGREIALRHQARYINGLVMFRAQAQAQREYWDSLMRSE